MTTAATSDGGLATRAEIKLVGDGTVICTASQPARARRGAAGCAGPVLSTPAVLPRAERGRRHVRAGLVRERCP